MSEKMKPEMREQKRGKTVLSTHFPEKITTNQTCESLRTSEFWMSLYLALSYDKLARLI